MHSQNAIQAYTPNSLAYIHHKQPTASFTPHIIAKICTRNKYDHHIGHIYQLFDVHLCNHMKRA